MLCVMIDVNWFEYPLVFARLSISTGIGLWIGALLALCKLGIIPTLVTFLIGFATISLGLILSVVLETSGMFYGLSLNCEDELLTLRTINPPIKTIDTDIENPNLIV